MPRHKLFLQFLCWVILSLYCSVAAESFDLEIPTNDHTNFLYFAVKLHDSEERSTSSLHKRSQSIAESKGYINLGQIGTLPNWFLFATPRTTSKLTRKQYADEREHWSHVALLKRHEYVNSVSAQVPKRRLFKRDGLEFDEERDFRRVLSKRQAIDESIYKKMSINDPGFKFQWHLVNREFIGNDLNVTPLWQQGITGKNVTVCFIDDGLDYEHPDLKDNFFAEGSYDYNDHRKLPTPSTPEDHHGTRCAGEVAAIRNDVCGVGIAWDSKVSGVRILSGDLTEVDEALAINYAYQENHIYSCSWGPSDNGKAMDAPPEIVADAVVNGIKNGRGGKGSVFVFASGNGGNRDDNCNFDGYTNSIYTITVGALTEINGHPGYSEPCSANMIVAYSSGHNQAIYTSDWSKTCTSGHGGTSAAAPLVSGVIALALELRPDLTWRDLQYIAVRTATPINLSDSGWITTSGGLKYNHKFGFGKIDATKFVEYAKHFQNVNPQTKYRTPDVIVDKDIPQDLIGADGKKKILDTTNGNNTVLKTVVYLTKEELDSVKLRSLEHVTVTVSISHTRRGDVGVSLNSPNGIVSELAVGRKNDDDKGGFKNWTFMSVVHWEENPVGEWRLEVSDKSNEKDAGKLISWYITFYGESSESTIETSPQESTSLSSSTITTTAAAKKTSSDFINPTETTTSSKSELNAEPETEVGTPSTDSTLKILIIFGSLIGVSAIVASLYFVRKRKWTAAVERGGGNYEFEVFGEDVSDAFEDEEEDDDEERALFSGVRR
ncbi:pheromone processing endoprotease [Nowakowskiella sp. JEL0407]|nr:pheromone processing endoprotease [Nowakowskiella sp. JEL0407]